MEKQSIRSSTPGWCKTFQPILAHVLAPAVQVLDSYRRAKNVASTRVCCSLVCLMFLVKLIDAWSSTVLIEQRTPSLQHIRHSSTANPRGRDVGSRVTIHDIKEFLGFNYGDIHRRTHRFGPNQLLGQSTDDIFVRRSLVARQQL